MNTLNIVLTRDRLTHMLSSIIELTFFLGKDGGDNAIYIYIEAN